ncbi:MAG TPA: NAD(P)/FAD-dependent oxidoreductase [Roseateles sp.]|nr:NAD(P)/FAD-dependent oxidoreductase [Roseateles sp.]
MNTEPGHFDAIVVGGSYAGLSAALQLARARRRVLVIDAGLRRNRFAAHSHGFLGPDGRAPGEIVAEGRAQLLAYPNVRWVAGQARRARRIDAGLFGIAAGTGEPWRAQRLVLAGGVVDELPLLEGLAQRWGRSVFHCPYCHGYELARGRIGVLAVGPSSLHQAMMLPDWGEVTLFLNGALNLDPAGRAALLARGVRIEARPVRRLFDSAGVELDDGQRIPLDGLFLHCRTQPTGDLHRQLGCALEEGPLGPVIQTNAQQETSVPGVFACGDAARMAGSVALAVGDGALAGVAAHRSMVFG